MILTKRRIETREAKVVLARVNAITTYEIFTEGWIIITSLAKKSHIQISTVTLRRTFLFINFVDDIFCPWNFYYGRYPYTVNPVEYFSLQIYLLKKTYRRSLLVPFSSPFVLVDDYFYLSLSLSPHRQKSRTFCSRIHWSADYVILQWDKNKMAART